MKPKLIPISAVCLWMLLMFGLSTSIGGFDNTHYIVEASIHKLSVVLPLNVSPYTTNFINIMLRKGAHFSEYGVLMALGYWFSTRSLKIKPTKGIFITLALVIIFAFSDEFHQSFVPGRSPLLTDTLIDTSGAIVSAVLLFWFDAKSTLSQQSRFRSKQISRKKL